MPVVEYETRDHIAYITLNRPDALNALNRELSQALASAWHRYNADPDAWVAILTANGRSFCAGADLKDRAGPTDEPPQGPTLSLGHGIDVFKPIVVGIHGHCLAAGIDLVLPCDIRVAAEDASFGMTMTRWGVIASTGASQLPRSIPWALAMEMLLTGERVDAAEAYRIGLVNRVVPREELLEACEQYAHRILRNSPAAVRLTKEAAIRGRDAATMAESLKVGFSLARLMRTTPDATEGPRAFAEKRDPVWSPVEIPDIH